MSYHILIIKDAKNGRIGCRVSRPKMSGALMGRKGVSFASFLCPHKEKKPKAAYLGGGLGGI